MDEILIYIISNNSRMVYIEICMMKNEFMIKH